MKITRVTASEIRDSRNRPTLAVRVLCEDGSEGTFSVPSGASTGRHEAHELRDGPTSQSHVSHAIDNVTKGINTALSGIEVTDQKKIDTTLTELDGTSDKSRLGGNALIGVSIANAKAAARTTHLELYEYLRTLARISPSRQGAPLLYMNVINGGKHAKSRLAFQEYMIVPQTETLEESLGLGVQVLQSVEQNISERYGKSACVIGDEGGVALDVKDPEVPLQILHAVKQNFGERGNFRLALDIAGSSLFINSFYQIGGRALSKDALMERLVRYASTYDLLSIEDPFEEEDFASFRELKSRIPRTTIVGDDLTTTNSKRVGQAINENSIGAVIIKPNQIGTLSETLETMSLAREHRIDCIVSHRSGETTDTFIADLAFAFGVFGIKVGAPRTRERLSKIERLIEIESLEKSQLHL